MRSAIVLMIVLATVGCHKSDSDSSAGSTKASGVEKQAEDFVMAQVLKHWTKAPDGYITERWEGSSLAPVKWLREIREIVPTGVDSDELTDSDKLNGIEWAGEVYFKESPCREVGDIGIVLAGMANVTVNREKGAWSQWIDFKPENVKVQKAKGQWQIQTDTWLLRGTIPTPADFANAGVK